MICINCTSDHILDKPNRYTDFTITDQKYARNCESFLDKLSG